MQIDIYEALTLFETWLKSSRPEIEAVLAIGKDEIFVYVVKGPMDSIPTTFSTPAGDVKVTAKRTGKIRPA